METDRTGHDDFGGLSRDWHRPVERRQALQWFGALGLTGLLVGCSSDVDTSPTSHAAADQSSTTAGLTPTTGADTPASSTTDSAAPGIEATPGAEIPSETAGPFPADGSNGPNVLEIDGIVRTDLTSSIGDLGGMADGLPTTIELTVVEATNGAPLPGAAVYLWHCTADGHYSVYEVADQNYLRGLQAADDAGRISFTTVFPGCYRGRWPHCHFEVYDSIDDAGAGSRPVKISQFALPQAECEAVYRDSRYGESSSNLAQLSLAGDNVFADGWEHQLATVTGSVEGGYTVSLLVRFS